MFVSAGSVSTHATSPWASSRSTASRSLNAHTRVVVVTSAGAPTLPSRAHDPPVAQDREGLVDRAVVAAVEHEDLRAVPRGDGHRRRTQRLASVAESAKLHVGRPKRSASSPATRAASSVGSIVVAPPRCVRRSVTASATGRGLWPAIAPVSPRHRST